MSPERWALIQQLFESAIRFAPTMRHEFVETKCADDALLREELSSLLNWYGGAETSLDAVVAGSFRDLIGPGSEVSEFRGTERFLLQRRIGEGGFGVVYQAYDCVEHMVVALKHLRDPRGLGPAQLKREFRVLADLIHPNLVRLYELFSEGGVWFISMELLDARHLTEYVQALAANCSAIRSLFAQLADGLRTLHDAGVLHCDLKPANVLVTPQGRVVICDFGLAIEAVKARDTFMRFAGTAAYMSPEQLAGNPPTPASDWYSFGIVLFEALTGQLPFQSTLRGMAAAKTGSNGPAPSGIATGIPPDLDELCQNLLRSDPEQRPTGPEILRTLGEVHLYKALPGLAASVWVGREPYLKILNEAFQRAQTGETAIVCVEGISGTGKSALVRRFLQSLQNSGAAHVFSGRCYEMESVPYKALDDVMDGLARYLRNLTPSQGLGFAGPDVSLLSRLFPVFDGTARVAGNDAGVPDAKELRQVAAGALHRILCKIGSEKCLVLFIDDLHWGDSDSAGLLTGVLRSAPCLPLLLIAAFRGAEAETSPFLRALFSQPEQDGAIAHRIRLSLGELTPDESCSLASSLLGEHVAPALVERIASESGGNPFFLQELAIYHQKMTGSPGVPTGLIQLTQVIQRHLSDLPADALRLLEVLAIAAQPIDWHVARQAASQNLQRYAVLGLLRARRLIRVRSTGQESLIEIYHDRIREAVAELVPASERRELHYSLGRVLEESGTAAPEDLAIHYQQAGCGAKAGEYAILAARHASRLLAFDSAVRFFRMALDLQPAGADKVRSLQIELADAHANAGHGAEAAGLYLEARTGGGTVEVVDLGRKAAAQFLTSGHMEEGIGVLSDVLRQIGLRLPPTSRQTLMSLMLRRLWLRLRAPKLRERGASEIPQMDLVKIDTCWAVIQGFGMVDTIRAAYFQTLHLTLALRAGEAVRIGRALAVEASYYAISGTHQRVRTEQTLERALSFASRAQHPYLSALVLLVSGMAAFLRGEWRQACQQLEQAESALRENCVGVIWELATARLMGSVSLFFSGEIKELAARLPALLSRAEARGDRFEAIELRIRISHVTLLAGDEPDRAQMELEAALSRWTSRPFHLQHWWGLLAGLEIALYRGQGLRACEMIRAAWSVLRRSLLLRVQYVLIESLHHRAAGALAAAAEAGPRQRTRERWLRLAARDATRIEHQRTAWGDGLALLIRAGVSCSSGSDRTQTVELLEQAERQLEITGMHLFAAAARHRRGALLGDVKAGKLIRESSDAWMAEQGIRDRERMLAMLAPGDWSA